MMTLKEIKPDDPNYYKPLDELIEDLGHAEPASRYGDVQIMVEDLTDALHYLKEYKAHQADWSYAVANSQQFAEARDKHIKALAELKQKEKEYNDILTDYVALKTYWAEQQANPPLTWEELRQMEGKPVWVEMHKLGYHPWSGWEVIDPDGVDDKWLTTYRDDYARDEMGKTWQAYRKERG